MEYSKIVKKECPMCGKTYFVKLTEVEYDQYKKYIAYKPHIAYVSREAWRTFIREEFGND